MSVHFKKVRWKNLLSTGNSFVEMNLNTGTKTIIVGQNGSGKSTLLEAMTFCLYGKPFRNINKPQLVNSVNGKACLVELEFSIGNHEYMVRRGIKPNVFEIYKNDKLVDIPGKLSDYQEYLETVIKIGYKAFTQTVILGSSGFTPFMRLPAASRREFIENLLDINIFTTMNAILKTRVKENQESIRENEQSTDLLLEKIKLQNQYIEKSKADNSKRIEALEKDIETSKNTIAEIESEISSIEVDMAEFDSSEIDKLEKKIKSYYRLQNEAEMKIKSLKKDISLYEAGDECPTCKQPIDEHFGDEIITKKKTAISKYEQGLEKLSAEIGSVETQIDDIKALKLEHDELVMKLNNLRNDIKNNRNWVLKCEKEIESLSTGNVDIENNENLLETYTNNVTINEEEKNSLLEQKKVLEISGKLLKDSGIKTRIIEQYVPVINKRINHYLKKLDFFVLFELDSNFDETIKSRHRDNFSYESFSEGQKMRIDLALLMTWRDIAKMKNSVNTNLLILDEVFDASLDNDGCDNFMQLLDEMDVNINPFVISHKGDVLIERFDRVVEFSMEKNFTSMQISKE